ncbi:hypothetical protein C8R44DRAFT_336223 [Mycena epipterygia]|nr:hypothetical protein C8R44DRAFT_336223 [Mycena epipterygia]
MDGDPPSHQLNASSQLIQKTKKSGRKPEPAPESDADAEISPRRSGRLLRKHPDDALDSAHTSIPNSGDSTLSSDGFNLSAFIAALSGRQHGRPHLPMDLEGGRSTISDGSAPIIFTPTSTFLPSDSNLLSMSQNDTEQAKARNKRRMEGPSSAEFNGLVSSVTPIAAEKSALDSTNGRDSNEDINIVDFPPPSFSRLITLPSSDTASVSTPFRPPEFSANAFDSNEVDQSLASSAPQVVLCLPPSRTKGASASTSPLHNRARAAPKQCSSCKGSTTRSWHKSKLNTSWTICEACYSYERRRHKLRPASVVERTKMRTVKKCSNCDTTTSAGDKWRFSVLDPLRKLCQACGLYEDKHHKSRPLSLIQRMSRTLIKKEGTSPIPGGSTPFTSTPSSALFLPSDSDSVSTKVPNKRRRANVDRLSETAIMVDNTFSDFSPERDFDATPHNETLKKRRRMNSVSEAASNADNGLVSSVNPTAAAQGSLVLDSANGLDSDEDTH